MLRRALSVLLVAAPLAALDLAHKAVAPTPDWAYHVRSSSWVLLALGLVAMCFALARVPSRAVGLAAGVLAGGAAGNLVSAVTSERGIPNPIVVGDPAVVAFNVADVFTLVGIALLMATLVATTIRNREQLLPPRAFARMLRRRLSAVAGD
jgi:hypothetical protein